MPRLTSAELNHEVSESVEQTLDEFETINDDYDTHVFIDERCIYCGVNTIDASIIELGPCINHGDGVVYTAKPVDWTRDRFEDEVEFTKKLRKHALGKE